MNTQQLADEARSVLMDELGEELNELTTRIFNRTHSEEELDLLVKIDHSSEWEEAEQKRAQELEEQWIVLWDSVFFKLVTKLHKGELGDRHLILF